MKFMWGCVLSIAVLATALLAADKAKKPQRLTRGDKVEVEFLGKTIVGEFVDYAPTGWMNVTFEHNGREITRVFPPNQVRAVASPDKAANKGGENAGGAKLRIWSDKTGKIKVKAKFVELNDGAVTLEASEGKTITMALDKLSSADQKAARDAAREAAKDDDDRPLGQKGDDGDPSSQKGKKNLSAPGAGLASDTDWSGVKHVVVEDPGKGSIEPDAEPAFEKSLASKPIILASMVKSKTGGQLGFFDEVEELFFDRQRGAAFAVINTGPSGKGGILKLQRIDLVQGKAQDPLDCPNSMQPFDIDPTGNYLAARIESGTSNGFPERGIGVWKITDKGLQPVRVWNLRAPGDRRRAAPTLARFIDADRLVTVSSGKLVLWQVSSAKAVYTTALADGTESLALSANRKYLALEANSGPAQGVYVIEALTGRTVAKLPGEQRYLTALAFRPDGKQLAALTPNRLIVWNLDDGEIDRDLNFSPPIQGQTTQWLGNSYLMVGGENLVDLERRIVLWKYQLDGVRRSSRPCGEMGGFFWYALTSADRKERGLFRAKLPHDDALKVADGLEPEKLFAVRPGANVSLNFAAQGDAGERQKSIEALTAQLRKLGMNVVNTSALVLQASTETGKTSQMEYRPFDKPSLPGEIVTATEQISRLKFVENGKVVWEASSVMSAPGILQMKRGESAQQALAPYQKPNQHFFVSIKLPQYVARTNEAGAYGASTLSPQGIQAAQLAPAQSGPVGK